jgi:hypothetical protein
MSYDLNAKPFSDLSFLDADSAVPMRGDTVRNIAAANHAIDAALRNVPLPSGLMTRLGKLAFTVPDETADQVDWLGC